MDNIIDKIYNFEINYFESKNKTGFPSNLPPKSDVYGEVTKNGALNLTNHFQKYFNKNTVFYDLGSGFGKMVLMVGLKFNVKKSIGIEYSKERHQLAIDIKNKYVPNSNNIEFYNKSFLDHDLSNATVVYYDNTMYTNEQDLKVYNLLPSKCLFLFKCDLFCRDADIKRTKIKDLVQRDYKQNDIFWLVKE